MSADMPEIDRDRMQVLAERFRGEADECRQMAEGASSPHTKAEWLRLADEWTKLAQSVGP
jgi:hypothetical protein